MRPLSCSIPRAAAQGTPPAKSAVAARARRARRNLPKPVKPSESKPPIAAPTIGEAVAEEEKKDDYGPDFFAVDPEVIKLDSGSAAAAAASGAVVVISSSSSGASSSSKSAAAGTAAAAGAKTGSTSRAASLDAQIAALPPAEVDRRTDLIMALATSGTRFEQVLAEGLRQCLIDEVTLRLLERRLSAAKMSVGGGEKSNINAEEEVTAIRGLAELWSRLRSEVERQSASPAERAIDDALRELAAAPSGAVGRERAETALRRAAELSGAGRGIGGAGSSGGGGGIDIFAVAAAAASELEVDDDKDEGIFSSSSPPYEVVPVAVISATCSTLLAAARRQVNEVERALKTAREQQVKGVSSSSSPSSLSPAFGRAECLAADRRELVAALQVVLDIVNGI